MTADVLQLIAMIGLLCLVLAVGGSLADRFDPDREDARRRNHVSRRR